MDDIWGSAKDIAKNIVDRGVIVVDYDAKANKFTNYLVSLLREVAHGQSLPDVDEIWIHPDVICTGKPLNSPIITRSNKVEDIELEYLKLDAVIPPRKTHLVVARCGDEFLAGGC